MVANLLPESIYGMDTDDILAYQTPKLALIRDRYVGALYYFLVTIAMCWVLVGQVLWRNEHFLLKDVKGTPRMWISHPTVNQCDPNLVDCMADFKSLSDLPYCKEHEGGPQVEHPAHCAFADKHSMFTDGTLGGSVFVPTSMIVIEEVEHCHPSSKNKHSCDNEYKKKGLKGYYLNETQLTYYADIEDYIIQLTSTYHREDIFGTSLDHPGFFMECFDESSKLIGHKLSWKERMEKRKRACKDQRRMGVECMEGIECHKGGLKQSKLEEDLESLKVIDAKSSEKDSLLSLGTAGPHERRYLRSDQIGERNQARIHSFSAHRGKNRKKAKKEDDEDNEAEHEDDDVEIRLTPDVYASTWGDTFKLGKLMQLANVDLDRHYNMDGMSTRMSGTIIEVEATYSNLRRFLSSFGLSQVQYSYRVRERSLPYVSKESLHPDQPEDYPQRRRYLVQHGILIDFKVGGEFGFFSIVYLLIMLTTSLALLAAVHKMTDLTSIYLHPRKKNYFHLKYDVSGDFSDMWQCTTCGYYNLPHQKNCEGLDKWQSAHDTKPCGEPRPRGYTPHNSMGSQP